jgi:hypothetical protein
MTATYNPFKEEWYVHTMMGIPNANGNTVLMISEAGDPITIDYSTQGLKAARHIYSGMRNYRTITGGPSLFALAAADGPLPVLDIVAAIAILGLIAWDLYDYLSS